MDIFTVSLEFVFTETPQLIFLDCFVLREMGVGKSVQNENEKRDYLRILGTWRSQGLTSGN